MSEGRIIKESSRRTPHVVLEDYLIFIMGRSIPDDAAAFYVPLMERIEENAVNYPGDIRVELGFEYINTTSTKWIFILLRKLSELKGKNAVKVNWYYEAGDDDMSELGYMLKSLVEVTLNVTEVDLMDSVLYQNILDRQR
jgi:hypothetical protein